MHCNSHSLNIIHSIKCTDLLILSLYSTIHKAAGLTVPGRSMILPGTIPETPISREWSRRLERPLGVVPTAGRMPTSGFVNSAVTALFTKPLASGWNDRQRSFQLLAPFTAYGSFRNCTRQNHGTAGNREAGDFVNSAVTALFTKLPDCLLPYRTVSGSRSCRRLHSHPMGHFSVEQQNSGIVPGKAGKP